MKDVQQWTAVICLSAIVATIAQSLIPSGSMERMGKFVVGAFVLCAIISPLTKLVPQINVALQSGNQTAPQAQTEQLQSTVNQQVISASQKSIINLVTAELSRIRIKCKNVQVVMDTNPNGRISITKVIVELDKKDAGETKAAADYLEKELGIQTEVVADGS